MDIRIGIYKPLKGSCEKKLLPTELKNKKGIISVKSNDNRCFIWCILAFMANIKNKTELKNRTQIKLQNVSALKKFEHNLKLEGIEMPMKLKNICKFETKNKHLNLRINVYSWETIDLCTQALVPILISKRKSKSTVNLLLYQDHFYYIKNFNRIMSSFGSNSRKFCYNCMSGFLTQKRL